LKEEVIIIQFRSLEQVLLSLVIPLQLIETNPTSSVFDEDDKGWILFPDESQESKDEFSDHYFVRRKVMEERSSQSAGSLKVRLNHLSSLP